MAALLLLLLLPTKCKMLMQDAVTQAASQDVLSTAYIHIQML
jgi:hypothetical protein